ncbi:hypothetical protein [Pararhodospirillum photometricum]|nr:hypothetical protein [Pararhodospirillum photometricum]
MMARTNHWTALLVGAAALLISTGAEAGSYRFNLHNSTSQYVITSFKTKENGVWSSNWLNSSIQPGETAVMEWNSDEGDCVVPFRVGWKGYETEQFQADWCKVTNIYMQDEGFTWD